MSPLKFSQFGEKLGGDCGILELMDDLGKALEEGGMRMMGGGNPALIPEVVDIFQNRLATIASSKDEVAQMLGIYQPPQGGALTIEALAAFLQRQYNWDITPDNIAVTSGGQTAFFLLFNMLGGTTSKGAHKRILLPLTPEYIGYANQSVTPDLFHARPPKVTYRDDGFFKYGIDFDQLTVGKDIGAICVSRPTNPTGNVLTDAEMARLADIAEEHEIPLIVDNAYGAPFPHILFEDIQPAWTPNRILTMSLSKLGLPGTRTAFVVGSPEVIRRISAANCVLNLANNNLGQALIRDMLIDDSILSLSHQVIRPFYENRSRQAIAWVREAFGTEIPVEIHRSEGALFLWLRFPKLPISSAELYQRLKARKVLVVSGHYFFFGLTEPHEHEHQCLRMTFSQTAEVVHEGIAILADEVGRVFAEA